MALRIKISAQAAKEVRKAVEWWAANRPAAPGAVGSDFGACVALLADQPSLGAIYEGGRIQGVRRLFLGRVKYFVYYRVVNGELHILAFWHASRGQQPDI